MLREDGGPGDNAEEETDETVIDDIEEDEEITVEDDEEDEDIARYVEDSDNDCAEQRAGRSSCKV